MKRLRGTLTAPISTSSRRSSLTSDRKLHLYSFELYSQYINKGKISEVESVMMWNLNPDDYAQAVAFIPSLSNYSENTVKEFIDALKNKRGTK